ncbi:MAG: hypothetical protein NVV59_07285 [Chitinophagaceae bacterium]|nr:hypothetical protein [Chitinophagaceae bacterium]
MKKVILAISALLFSGLLYAQTNPNKRTVCFIYKGELISAESEYNPSDLSYTVIIDNTKIKIDLTGEHAKGKSYAANHNWYLDNETIEINKVKYQKFGLPRVLSTEEIKKYDEYQGVGAYRETPKTRKGAESPKEETPFILYIPVRPLCEFQPYVRSN